MNERIEVYEAMRLRQGWTKVRLPWSHKACLWLHENAGPEVRGNNWSEDPEGGVWEEWSDGWFLIKDSNVAILAKLSLTENSQ